MDLSLVFELSDKKMDGYGPKMWRAHYGQTLGIVFPISQGFAWGQNEKNVVQWFKHTFLVITAVMIFDTREMKLSLRNDIPIELGWISGV